MQYLPRRTLSSIYESDIFKNVDYSYLSSELMCTALRRRNIEFTEHKANPDKEAYRFYLYNHIASRIRQRNPYLKEINPVEMGISRKYFDEVTSQGQRMIPYLFWICTRECRHMKGWNYSKGEEDAKKIFGDSIHTFFKDNRGKNASTVIEGIHNGEVKGGTLLNWTKGMVHTFESGKYSSGFGGMKWADIARTLHRYISGQTSLEVMLDTAYTLSHNNGPIYNKGMAYKMYTDFIKVILDVQRAGQIPAMLYDSVTLDKSIVDMGWLSKEEVGLLSAYYDLYPEERMEYVDWYAVEDAGSLGKYLHQKKKQLEAFGVTEDEQEYLKKLETIPEKKPKKSKKPKKDNAEKPEVPTKVEEATAFEKEVFNTLEVDGVKFNYSADVEVCFKTFVPTYEREFDTGAQ